MSFYLAESAATIDTGSTAWMLASSMLVLLMVPGLALVVRQVMGLRVSMEAESKGLDVAVRGERFGKTTEVQQLQPPTEFEREAGADG